MGRVQEGMDATAASLAAVDLANRKAGSGSYASRYEGGVDERLHYVVAGNGPTILFLHGFPSFWYCWIRQMEHLRGEFRVVAVDAPGAGASFRNAGVAAYRAPKLADRLARFIAAIASEEKVLLVGHDWGAALGFALAQARPDLFVGVTGIAAPPYNQFLRLFATDPEQRVRSQYMAALRSMTKAQAEAAGPRIGPDAYGRLLMRGEIDSEESALFARACGDPAALWAGAAWYGANMPDPADSPAAFAWPGADPPFAIPAQLVWGEADQTFVSRAPDDFVMHHTHATVRRLKGVGHWCMLQAPQAVTTALSQFAEPLFARQTGAALT